MPAPQSAKNHTALDPLSHFVMTPLSVIALILSLTSCKQDWPAHRIDHLWMIIASTVLVLGTFKMRLYALRLQDRIVLDEVHLRLTTPPAAVFASLSKQQLIALRFASDAELLTLAQRAAQQNLTPTQIKQSIQTWRPDHHRV